MIFDREGCEHCGLCAEVCPANALTVSGNQMTVEEVLCEIRKDLSYYRESGGGITLSGGECLLQPLFTAALLRACREEGIHTAIETALFVPWEYLEAVLPYVDLIFADLKLADSGKHKQYTGQGNEGILENLQKLVKEKGLDAGFAFDGDADRCLAVDEKGNLLTGDHILYLYACYMKKRGMMQNQKVVTTVMSNFGLYKALDELETGYEKTAVGDKYVWENMSRHGYLLGGEQSGHIIFARYANTGDGILTAIRVMEAMLFSKWPLSKLTEGLTVYPQKLKNVKVVDKQAALEAEGVRRAVEEVSARLEENGRVLLRASGTEPVLRVMAEAETMETCEKAVDDIIAAMKACGVLAEEK